MSNEDLPAEIDTTASHDDKAASSTAPEAEVNTEASATETQDQSKKTANPVQPRINQLTRKVHDTNQENEALRAKLAEFEQAKPLEVKVAPNEDDFETSQEFHTANAQYYAEVSGDAADARVSASDSANKAATAKTQRQTELETKKVAFEKNLDSKRDHFEDFEDVAYGHQFMDLDLAEQLFDMSKDPEGKGPEVAYHLGSNLDEAQRIFALSPVQRARELTKLEFQVEALAPKKVSDAPDPINPLGNSETVQTDPDQMNADEWRVWRNKQVHG